MTEVEWLACKDPTDLLVFEEHRSADRKLRLFACACVYRIWDCLWHKRCRAAVRVGERLADGGVGDMLRDHPPLRDQAWMRYRVKDGEKGPMVWEAKSIPIYPKNEAGLPERTYRLVVTRNVLAPDEVKYFVSNAPEAPLPAVLLVAFSRWRVERCFEDEKGELGLDHYEGRKYQGLKRHLILTAVSHLFLAQVHQELRGEKPGADGVPGADRDVGCGEGPVAVGPVCDAAA